MTWNSIRRLALGLGWIGSVALRESPAGWDSRALANRLGVSVDTVNVALTDLCMFGLIELKGE